MGIGLLLELRVRDEYHDRFLHATRLYSQHTRNEASRPRVEILERSDARGEFVIRELYPNELAIARHERSEHARHWLEVIAPFVAGAVVARRVSVVVSEPPPLPRAHPPALETSTVLPSRHAEAHRRLDLTKRPKAPTPPARLHLPRLQVAIERIEIAGAHAGFLRGKPDLCLLAGCYRVGGFEAEPLGRAVYRFELAEAPPCEIRREDRLLDLPVLVSDFPLRVSVVVLAFEESGGTDVRAAYQDLSDPSALFVWNLLQPEPNPIRLAQYAAQLEPNQCERVQTLRAGEAHVDSAEDDVWVGAASGVVEFTALGQERLLRCHTQSPDGRNDWLWVLSLRFAGP